MMQWLHLQTGRRLQLQIQLQLPLPDLIRLLVLLVLLLVVIVLLVRVRMLLYLVLILVTLDQLALALAQIRAGAAAAVDTGGEDGYLRGVDDRVDVIVGLGLLLAPAVGGQAGGHPAEEALLHVDGREVAGGGSGRDMDWMHFQSIRSAGCSGSVCGSSVFFKRFLFIFFNRFFLFFILFKCLVLVLASLFFFILFVSFILYFYLLLSLPVTSCF